MNEELFKPAETKPPALAQARIDAEKITREIESGELSGEALSAALLKRNQAEAVVRAAELAALKNTAKL